MTGCLRGDFRHASALFEKLGDRKGSGLALSTYRARDGVIKLGGSRSGP